MAFAASFLNEIAFSSMINLPGYFTGLGVSEGQIGLVFSVAGVASLMLRPVVGRYLDLAGRKPVLLVAGVGNAVSLILFTTVSVYGPWMFFVRALFVVSEIAMFTAFLAYVADTLPEVRRTQGLALYGLSGLIPIGLASLGAEIVLDRWDFQGLFLIATGGVVASWTLVWFLPRRPSDERGTLPRRSVLATVLQRDLIPLWVVTFVFASGVNVLFSYMRTFVDEAGIGSVGLFFGVYSGSAVFVRLSANRLPDRLGYRRVLVPTVLAVAASQFLLAAATSEQMLVAAAVLGGAAHGFIFPILTSELVRRARVAERGSAIAMFTSLFDIGIIAVVPVIGSVIDGPGYPAAFRTAGVLVVVGLMAFLYLDTRVQRVAV